MQETEYKEILDRSKHAEDVQTHFKDALLLLRNLTNYGTNLIPRAYTSSDRGLAAAITIGVLLKQVVSMLDAVEILVSKGHIHAAHLEARAAYEASIYIDWILKENSEEKVRHYYVSNLRNERLWARRTIDGTEEKSKFSTVTEQLNIDITAKNPTLEQEVINYLAEVNRILSQDNFKPIDSEFERLKNTNRNKLEPNWYKPLQIHSVRHIARLVERLPEYDIFYAKGSQVTHSASYKDHIRFSGGTLNFKPIRYLENIDNLLNFTISLVLKTYKAILAFYRPAEMPNFNRKYLNEWRDAFLKIKSVKYKSTGEHKVI